MSDCRCQFNTPVVGVTVIPYNLNGQILLIKREELPNKGEWGTIGGYLNAGEGPMEGASRELYEETKIKMPLMTEVNYYPVTNIWHNEEFAGLDFLYTFIPLGSVPNGEWFYLDKLPNLAMSSNREAVKYFKEWYDTRFETNR